METAASSKVVIEAEAENGEKLSASFLPNKGMNCISFKKGAIEAIDQSTKNLFEERYAGLGAMIGPHFHHRNPSIIPHIQNESLFPHIALVKAKGSKEPFSHGIGRYAPWTVKSATASSIKAVLKGGDLWNGVALKALEGQDFSMEYEAKISGQGLEIVLSVASDTESVVGLHTYYALPTGTGRVLAKVQNTYNDKGIMKPIPAEWKSEAENHLLSFDLTQEADYGFHSFPDPLHGSIILETGSYSLQVSYWSDNKENSWQLWHPKGGSFVCIEPLSASDPRKPILSVSRIKIRISIL